MTPRPGRRRRPAARPCPSDQPARQRPRRACRHLGADALRTVAAVSPDLVILDLGLPDLDGVEVIHGVRGWSEVPIIVLSGRGGGPDKVAALDAGADDYVTKPFGMDELLARIRAVTRRSVPGDAAPAPRVEFGDVTVDLADKAVTRTRVDGATAEPVHLTPTEWSLLEALVRQPGKAHVPAPAAHPGLGARPTSTNPPTSGST